jgi:catechol 2,3-dioxygenase-like lactoylglutathione lyase family enzyme
MTIDINGMAHVILTVSQFDAARAFYRKLLSEFSMKPVHDGNKLFYASAPARRSAFNRVTPR